MLKKSLRLSLIVATAASAAHAQSIPSTTPSAPQIVTAGEGEGRATPDRASVYIGVQTRAATAASAAATNARLQRGIIDTLRSLGLTSDQLSTLSYSVSPEVKYEPGGAQKVTGYVVSNTVRAEVRKLDEIGRVIDGALGKGANQISGVEFYASNVEEARRTALASAVAKARTDAEVIAKAAGGTLGPLVEVVSNAFSPRPMPMMKSAVALRDVATPIEPGQEVVHASVTARWTFVPGR